MRELELPRHVSAGRNAGYGRLIDLRSNCRQPVPVLLSASRKQCQTQQYGQQPDRYESSCACLSMPSTEPTAAAWVGQTAISLAFSRRLDVECHGDVCSPVDPPLGVGHCQLDEAAPLRLPDDIAAVRFGGDRLPVHHPGQRQHAPIGLEQQQTIRVAEVQLRSVGRKGDLHRRLKVGSDDGGTLTRLREAPERRRKCPTPATRRRAGKEWHPLHPIRWKASNKRGAAAAGLLAPGRGAVACRPKPRVGPVEPTAQASGSRQEVPVLRDCAAETTVGGRVRSHPHTRPQRATSASERLRLRRLTSPSYSGGGRWPRRRERSRRKSGQSVSLSRRRQGQRQARLLMTW